MIESTSAMWPFSVDPAEFEGKHVLVTGGTQGIGEAIGRRLTMGRQQPALFVQSDIGTAEGVQAVVERVLSDWGGIDILVSTLGGSDAPSGGFQVLTNNDWMKALNVKLMAAERFDRTLLPGMLERRRTRNLQQRPFKRSWAEGRTRQCHLDRFC